MTSAANTTGSMGAYAIAIAATVECDDAGQDKTALAVYPVDQDADRGMQGDADEAARGQLQAERRLIPAGMGEEKYVHIGAHPSAHVG